DYYCQVWDCSTYYALF
nr:immunoglobulin light chain junction region [Macaca mulatta]MOW07347.1 immunoglobulin light chain junction region [Macaca mulatta]